MNYLNKYKFLICLDGSAYIPITLAKPVVISGSLDSKSYRYTRKCSAWKLVRYENPFVYDTLLPFIQRPTDLINEILVKIELWDNWSTLTEISFQGYIPLSGIQLNEDTGALELTPTERSVYDWYDHHKGDKLDVYNEVNSYDQLEYTVQTVTEEYWTPQSYIENGESVPYIIPAGFLGDYQQVSYYDQSKHYQPLYLQNSWAKVGIDLYHCIVSNGPNEPAKGPGNSIYWEKITQGHGTPSQNVLYITRQVSDMPFFTLSGGGLTGLQFVHGNGVYQSGFPLVKVGDDGSCTNLPTNRWSGAIETATSGTMKLSGSLTGNEITDSYIISEGRNQKLMDILNHFFRIDYKEVQWIGQDPSGLTIISQFLTSATNPITGTENHFANLRLMHNRAIKNIQDISTKGEMTLQQLIEDLCSTLNLSWCIIGTNLYIEHINYFINGFSYAPNPTIYVDATQFPLKYQVVNDLDGQKSDQEYKYPVSAPEKEVFHFPAGFDYDGQIKYDSKFVGKGEINQRDISVFMTDVAHTLTLGSDTIDDSWCLICASIPVNDIGIIYRRTAGLRWYQGPKTMLAVVYNNPFYLFSARKNTGLSFPNPVPDYINGDLMWNNILNDWFIYQTFFKEGQINGKYPSVSFTTQKKIRKQRELRLPRTQTGAFNPYYLITTNLGNGIVNSFEISTDTDFIKCELLHDEKP